MKNSGNLSWKLSPLGFFLLAGNPGDVFYSDKTDIQVTSAASRFGTRVATTRIRVAHPKESYVIELTQVVIQESSSLRNTSLHSTEEEL